MSNKVVRKFETHTKKHHFDTSVDINSIKLKLIFTIWQSSLGIGFRVIFVIILLFFVQYLKV